MNVSRDIHKNGYTKNIWQRSFHDHIIRDENDYLKIWNHIDANHKNGQTIAFTQNKKRPSEFSEGL